MPPSGSTFTDWQQDDNGRRLLMDEDFSWSEPPARTRRSPPRETVRERRSRTLVLERERERDLPTADETAQASPYRHAYEAAEAGYRTEHDAAFEAARQRWSDAYSEAVGQVEEADAVEPQEAFDRDDVASYANARVVEDRSGSFDLSNSGRRTVIITGRGDARYVPESRRRRGSELRFHERSGFNPDRAALWAVLLGVALLIGCVAH
jgi:hypothetical protein